MKVLKNNLQGIFSDPTRRDSIEETVISIINDGNIDLADKDGKNILFYAIESGNADLVDMILAAKANPNKKDGASEPALMFAIDSTFSGSDSSITAALLRYGADVNFINSNGNTPLKLAIDLKRRPCIKPLLTYGATIPPDYAKFIRNADVLERFNDTKLTRIVIWGELEELQEYLQHNPQLSLVALNNALNTVKSLRTTDKSDLPRIAEIQNELQTFKTSNYPSRLGNIYRAITEQWQQFKNFFERLFFPNADVKFKPLPQNEDVEILKEPETEVKKDYIGIKRSNVLPVFNNENNNDKIAADPQRSNPSKPRGQ